MATATRARSNLPAETTSFIGRRAEIGTAMKLLDSSRLVTLIGPGGVGKTRLAIRIAGELPRARFDDVRMVELSALQNAGLLPNTIAAALGLPEQTARSPIDVLVDYLADRNLLLILDTCEHLLDASATVVDILLRGAPRLHVLATSRQALDVPGEHTVAVAPMGSEAVALFVERARAVVPSFELTQANQEMVTALCRRLDGIPLAIELATVRLRAMPLTQLSARLSNRLRLLTAGRRTALERHQTLRSAITWSHDLCNPAERALWARLSVFTGGFDMDAVEHVCADGHLLAVDDILDHLLGLVDKSIVLWTESENGPRYALLDTLREFGREQLAATGEETTYLDRHRNYFRELADTFTEQFFGPEQESMYWRLHGELANFRAAIDHCFARKETAVEGLGLATCLWTYWVSSGMLNEGRYWMDKGLAVVAERGELRATALRLTAWFGVLQGEHDWPLPRVMESLEIGRELGNPAIEAYGNQHIGLIRLVRGEPEAEVYFATAQRMFDEAADDHALVVLHLQISFRHAMLGDTERGLREADVALRLLPASEERWARAWAAYVKAVCYWQAGDRRQAAEMASEGLWMKHALCDVLGVANCLEVLAWVAAAEQRSARAAWMLGAASSMWRKIGHPLFGVATLITARDAAEQAAKQALGDTGYERLIRAGAALTMAEAVRFALDDVDEIDDGKPVTAGLSALTRREREVARLVAQGLSNREIAERLVVSKRTADAHIEHIFTKLGFSSRAQIAALVAREEAVTP